MKNSAPLSRHTLRSKTRNTPYVAALGLALAAVATSPVHAQTTTYPTADAPAVYLQTGAMSRGDYTVAAGVMLPWQRGLWLKQLNLYWDIGISNWKSSVEGRNLNTHVVTVKPVWRWHGDEGQSRWFVEAGVGVSYALNRRYQASSGDQHREFSTRYNFASHAGMGYQFGAQRQHEMLLRIEHHSNAHIKTPNPGENIVQLRYALYWR